jgi:hypothetical protein
MRGGGCVGSQPMNTALHNAHRAQINFGDLLTPYLTYAAFIRPNQGCKNTYLTLLRRFKSEQLSDPSMRLFSGPPEFT